MASMKTVATPQGEVKLLPPPVELLDTINAFFPLGIVRYIPAQQGADHGVVIKRIESELFAVKRQLVDYDEKQSKITSEANRILIADSLSKYLISGFSGLFLPFVYVRSKGAGRFEPGIAFFGRPSPQGKECQVKEPHAEAYDHQFGNGFTTMFGSFIRALQQSSHDTGISLDQAIGYDVRSWSQLGSFALSFMIVGPAVICLKTDISEQDPVWTVLRSTGITTVFHMPSTAAILKSSAGRN